MMDKRFIITALIFASFCLCLTVSANAQTATLRAKDKAAMIKSTLLDADFLNRDLDDGEKKEDVYLLSENIIPTQMPKIAGINFILISKEELETKKQTNCAYYYFGDFKIKGSKVLVVFNKHRLTTDKFDEGGWRLTYEFKSVKGKWKGKVIDESRWINSPPLRKSQQN